MDTNTIPVHALYDTKGKPFLLPRQPIDVGRRVVALIREYLGRDYALVMAPSKDGQYLVPVDPILEEKLTAFERVTIETLIWHCRKYTQGLKQDASVTFPKLIHCGSDEALIAANEPLGFDDEARAYMFAEVAERCFPVDANVIETPAGWGVVVSSYWGVDEDVVSQLQGACQVLMHYAVDLDDDGADVSEGLHHTAAPAARHAWHDRKNAQQQRIEDGINAILAHLGHSAASAGAHTLFASKSSSASKEKANGKKPFGKEKAKVGA